MPYPEEAADSASACGLRSSAIRASAMSWCALSGFFWPPRQAYWRRVAVAGVAVVG